MTTERIVLPDPTKYRRMHVEPGYEYGVRWVVRAGPTADAHITHRTRRLLVWQGDSAVEATEVRDELQKRLSVARALLGLEV